MLPALWEHYEATAALMSHTCHGGMTKNVPAASIATWIPPEGGDCPCDGHTCMDARAKVGFPAAPLVDCGKHDLRKPEAKLIISWAKQRSERVASKLAECVCACLL